MRNFGYYMPGTALILTAILITAVPEILVALVAGLIIMTGIGALYVGHAVRKSRTDFQSTDRWFFDGFDGWQHARSPVFKTWHSWF